MNGRSPQVPSPAQPSGRAVHDLAGAGLVINSARREVQIDGSIVELTRIEYDVLEYLATHLSRVCTREEMVLAIWSSALTHDHHLVDVHVGQPARQAARATPTPPGSTPSAASATGWTARGTSSRSAAPAAGPYLVARIDSEDWARGLDF